MEIRPLKTPEKQKGLFSEYYALYLRSGGLHEIVTLCFTLSGQIWFFAVVWFLLIWLCVNEGDYFVTAADVLLPLCYYIWLHRLSIPVFPINYLTVEVRHILNFPSTVSQWTFFFTLSRSLTLCLALLFHCRTACSTLCLTLALFLSPLAIPPSMCHQIMLFWCILFSSKARGCLFCFYYVVMSQSSIPCISVFLFHVRSHIQSVVWAWWSKV